MASGTVRGITIEIEGKTSGLVKSLKSVNSALRALSRALRLLIKLLN